MRKIKKQTLWRNFIASMIRYERWRINPKNLDMFYRMEQMKWMTGFVCVACFILVSCTTLKKVEKVATKAEVKTETEVAKKVEEKKELAVSKSDESNSTKTDMFTKTESADTETTITDFDTDKPVNPATGKPPVKRETKIVSKRKSDETNKSQKSAETKTRSDSVLISSLKFKLDSMQRVNSKLTNNTESKETPKSTWYWWLLGGMCVPVAVWWLLKFK